MDFSAAKLGARPVGLALALALAWPLACDRETLPEEVSGDALVARLIAEDPQVLLSRDGLFTSETVFIWRFASEADVAPWTTQGLASTRFDRRLWQLRAAGDDPRLVREVELDASDVHLIEVALTGLSQGAATLFWAGPGEDFAEERSLTVEPPAARRGKHVVLKFDLAGHRAWRGTIERLRLDPTDAAADVVRLQSVRGVRRVVQSERLAEVLGRAWKFDLAADARNALLAVPGVPIDHEIEIGRDQRLHLSYGLDATVQQAVEFRVEAVADGSEAAEVLFQETLDPALDAGGQWHEATVDLGAYAGRTLRLRLVTETESLLDLARGFAVWGNPEILEPRREARPPNIIMISLDTLRADRLSAYGHHRQTSPNLDRWASRDAVLFENAVVQAPWTLPSHASMFTGLEALRHDVNHYQEAPVSLELLAETLRKAGYATAAITGGGYLRPRFGFAQGFDLFRYWPRILAERELADGMEHLFKWLDQHHSRQFFLFFHTYEVHFPHRRRQPYFDQFYGEPFPAGTESPIRGKIGMRARTQEPSEPLWQHDYFVVKSESGEEIEHLNEAEKVLARTMYDSAIAYVDTQLGLLFERLEMLGLKGRTLIILTSDHGEALGEKDRAGHNYHEDYNVMVPLVIELPGGLATRRPALKGHAGKRVEQQVRSIDIVPTILDVVDLPPPRPLDGVSLLPLIAGDSTAVPAEAWTYASSANYGLGLRYRNQLKYIFNNTAWSRFLGDEVLYNLRQDPEEETDQAQHHPSTEELRGRVQAAVEAQHEGLRLRIRNSGEGVLSGELKHDWARHNRVKAVASTCKCLRWGSDRTATFSLVSGQDITLYFESIPGHRVGLKGRFKVPGKPPAAFDETFDLRQIHQVVRFEHTDAGWRMSAKGEAGDVPPDSEAAVGFTLWKEQEHATLQVQQPVDAKLHEQLEALGYVNP